MHSLGSPFVRDQLAHRAGRVNEIRLVPDGELVLYWMQSTQRLDDNWALRFATLEADRLNRPLVIYHELTSDDAYACDRFHTFALEGAREIAREAEERGFAYRFVLHREARRAPRHKRSALGASAARATQSGVSADLTRLASRSCLVVTDALPTGGVRERTQALAAIAPCRVVAVDAAGVVPAALLPREEYAARTIRPKLAKLRDTSLEPVEDRAPRRAADDSLMASLDIDATDLARIDIAAEVARCAIDHSVGAVPTRGGVGSARERLASFVADGLQRYDERRREPSDSGGSSRLSPYLRHGHISSAEVARAGLANAPREDADAFLDQLLTWRELSLNFCLRNPTFSSLDSLPTWVRRTMDDHAGDRREFVYTLDELDRAQTHDALWNAGQRELVTSGHLHNAVRMLWGKSVLLWTETYADALRYLLHLNDKYALDGRDPNSYANILWCFGKFDRPFAARPVWGTIRPMSLSRAKAKFDVGRYIALWGAAGRETQLSF
jgi:deoxyribodipyrimidine photo-lyase